MCVDLYLPTLHRVARASAFAGVRACGSCAAILLVGLGLAADGERLYYVTVCLVALISDAVLSRLTSLVHFSMDTILVCYAQEVGKCNRVPDTL